MDDINLSLMGYAIEQANKSTHRFPTGAAITKGKRILSKAYNINKTHPKFGSGEYKTLHAEGHAIWKAVRQRVDLLGSTIYVYRQNNNLAKPCPCCMGLIHKYGIKEIIYSGH
jgi:deoxycytidylate deaminase